MNGQKSIPIFQMSTVKVSSGLQYFYSFHLLFFFKINDNSLLKLSYTKRIERPNYRNLNPFINTSDSKNISTGNTNLKPEIGKRYELDYSTDIATTGSFIASPFYRINEQDIQDYIVYYLSL